MPIYERISAVVSLTLLGLVAYFLIELPSRAIELMVWGSPLTLVVSQWWLLALLLVVAVVVGVILYNKRGGLGAS